MNFTPKGIVGGIVSFVVLVLAVIGFFVFTEKVDNGHVGIVYSANGGVQDDVLPQGWHVISPLDNVVQYPTKLRTVDAKDMIVSTKDGKNITLDLSYTYKVDATKVVSIYKEFGSVPVEDIEAGYMQRRLLDATRQTVSKYNLLEVYGEDSSKAQSEIAKIYEDKVKELGFLVQEVTLGAPKPDKNTQKSIDARIQASQENEKKKLELQNEKIEAEKKLVIAEGEAKAILAKAKAEAEANKEISKSITSELVEYKKTEKWNGSYVEVTGADNIIVDKKNK